MYAFVQARNYYAGRKRAIRGIVVHDMEAAEGRTTAESVARYFAGSKAPKASAHLNVDMDSVVQSVKINDTAWHAPNANADFIGMEHAGFARQSRAEWVADDHMLNLSAAAAAELCNRLWIPPVHLTLDQVRDGHSRGFCGHVDVSNAFHNPGGHVDPGNQFPWDLYLDKVRWFIPSAKGRNAAF